MIPESNMRLVDATGTYCPVPIIEIARAIQVAPSGASIALAATDPGTESDLQAWCRATRHALVSCGWEGKTFRAVVRKAGP